MMTDFFSGFERPPIATTGAEINLAKDGSGPPPELPTSESRIDLPTPAKG